jgi:putative peptidoglycan lipid II flippase
MGVWTAISRALGFGRVLVIAAVLGTTFLGNAFQAANSVSNVIFELLAAGALSAVLVPTFVRLLDRHEQTEAEEQAGSLLGVALLVLGAITLIGIALAPQIARLLTSNVADASIRESQEDLVAFLLRFFLPQVLLYAWGAIAIAVLHAHRRFAITAAAPIASSIVMVAFLGAFWLMTDGSTSLDLSTAEKLTLAGAGTLAVVGYVGVLLIAAERTGFRLRPHRPARAGPALRGLLTRSGWGVVLHSTAGALLGVAIVTGGAVEGGVVAYQVAFVFFLAPYAILAQPIQTTVLPELSVDDALGEPDLFTTRLRWAVESMTMLLVPVTVAFVVFARPGMEVLAFGNAAGGGVDLLAAAVASLGVGLLPYSAFLLLARSSYALDDSRTPALAALVAAAAGAAGMVLGAAATEGTATVAWLGLGHSLAYLVGTGLLAVAERRRLGGIPWPRSFLPAATLSVLLGALAWLGTRWIGVESRASAVVALGVVGVPAIAVYALLWRVVRPSGTVPEMA